MEVAAEVNNRPRKCLAWKTPAESSAGYSRPNQTTHVALTGGIHRVRRDVSAHDQVLNLVAEDGVIAVALNRTLRRFYDPTVSPAWRLAAGGRAVYESQQVAGRCRRTPPGWGCARDPQQ